MLEALVLDFDGTILDTETPEVDTWRGIFATHGATFPDEYWINAIGRGADQITESPLELLARLSTRPIHHINVRAEYEKLRLQAIHELDCCDGIAELISRIGSRGIPMGVASSSRHDWVDPHLARLGMNQFHTVVCADDVERAKPFPDLYLEVCRRLRADPQKSVAIEDSPNGIRAAKAAGLLCIAIPNPCTRRLDLSGADYQFESAKAIELEWIDAVIQDRA
ncbi:MAG TPA: HAD-IA family hydrolase [Fimbriimonadaceae bacterium]|nr:HAD-IA family hydrolase [Fimbriimonadaceae bacterium]